MLGHRPRPARLHLAARQRRPDRRVHRHPRPRGPRRRPVVPPARAVVPGLRLGASRSGWPATASRRRGCSEHRAGAGARRRAPPDRPVRRRVHPGHPLGAPRLRHRLPHAAGHDPPHRRLEARPHTGRRPPHRPGPHRAPSPTEGGIRLLLGDSTNAEEPAHTRSERSVGKVLDDLFARHEGRRIVTPASPATSTASSRSPTPPSPSVARSPRSACR